jgi:cyclase
MGQTGRTIQMLARRIIPSLLVNGRQLIKGRQYSGTRSVGVVAQAVRIHQLREVDELLLLDIAATPEKRGPDLQQVAELAEVCFSPLTVGGGIRTVADVRELLRHGADKVCVGTGAMLPGLISDLADRFGSSAIVVSVDAEQHKDGWRTVTECGTSRHLMTPVQLAIQAEEAGAGEILLNSIDREGTMEGYDLALIHEVSCAVNIPVIASGGCGEYEHMFKAIYLGADAVSAGAMFQFTEATPAGAADYLDSMGVETRCA